MLSICLICFIYLLPLSASGRSSKNSAQSILLSSVSASSTTLQATSSYTFQINRFGSSANIPQDTSVEIDFPTGYNGPYNDLSC